MLAEYTCIIYYILSERSRFDIQYKNYAAYQGNCSVARWHRILTGQSANEKTRGLGVPPMEPANTMVSASWVTPVFTLPYGHDCMLAGLQ